MKSFAASISLPFHRALPKSHHCEIVRCDEAEREAGGLQKVRGLSRNNRRRTNIWGRKNVRRISRRRYPRACLTRQAARCTFGFGVPVTCHRLLLRLSWGTDQQFLPTCADNMASALAPYTDSPLSLSGGADPAPRHGLGKVGSEPMSSALESRVQPPGHHRTTWQVARGALGAQRLQP